MCEFEITFRTNQLSCVPIKKSVQYILYHAVHPTKIETADLKRKTDTSSGIGIIDKIAVFFLILNETNICKCVLANK